VKTNDLIGQLTDEGAKPHEPVCPAYPSADGQAQAGKDSFVCFADLAGFAALRELLLLFQVLAHSS
jgi:hypothetical protein